MPQTKKIINDLVNLFLASLISFSFIYGKTSSLMFNYSPFKLYLIICGLILLFYIFSMNKITLIISLLLTGVLLAAAAAYIMLTQPISKIIFQIYSFFSWAMNYIEDMTPVNPVYKFYMVVLICVLVTLFVFVFTVKRFNFMVLVTYGSVFFIFQWYFKYTVSYVPFYFFIFTMLICCFKHIYIYKSLKEFNSYVSQAGFIGWTIPISAIILAITLIIPSNSGSGSSKWLDSSINSVYTFFTNIFNGYKVFEYFSLDSTGFNSSDHKLGGKVHLNKKLVLKVKSPRVTYLKGSCKEIYTGYSWKSGKKDNTSVILDYGVSNIDIYEMFRGISLFDDSGDMNKYLYNDQVSVTYQNLLTKSLFIPAKFNKLNITKPKSIKEFLKGTIEQNGIITSDHLLGKSFKYTLDAYNPMYNSKAFQNMMRKSKKGFYNELEMKLDAINKEIGLLTAQGSASAQLNTALDYSYTLTDRDLNFVFSHSIDQRNGTFPIPPDLKDKINELVGNYSRVNSRVTQIGSISADDLTKLASMAKEYYKQYLQLPKSMPDRVRKLANSITSSAKTDYDKVKAIEKYLSSKYPYTLTPKSTPSGRDFVDYFLFDLKEGYCVYYASAMTVMVRSIGLPARYVEGYVLPAAPNKNGIYEVTNQQAHAWVEVYLEGFGWIPFEPTSPYVSAFYNNATKANVSSSFSSNPDYLEYIKNLNKYSAPGTLLPDGTYSSSTKTRKPHTGFILITVVLVLILLIDSVILYNHIRYKIRVHMIKSLIPRERVIALFSSYVRLLTLYGLPIKPGETAVEYAERIDIYLLMSGTLSFRRLSSIFTSIRYSKRNIPTDDEAEFAFNLKSHLEYKIRKEFGIPRFLIFRYILGKI